MLSDHEFRELLIYFNRPWNGYRKVRKGVKKRLRRQMHKLGVNSLEHYLQFLENDTSEMLLFEESMCVTISRFFRDQALWNYLQDKIFPQLFSTFPKGINIWSIGCAGGEEVYSLAILLDLINQIKKVSILATDLRQENLQHGQKGVYRSSSLKEVPESIRSTYFLKISKNTYRISPPLRELIKWQKLDIFSKPPKGPFHLILMRNNILTYHQGQRQLDSLKMITKGLSSKGYLIVGSHESITNQELPLASDCNFPYLYSKP